MSENSGTDARFPYEHRQNVVVRLCMFLLLDQERPSAEICFHRRHLPLQGRDAPASVIATSCYWNRRSLVRIGRDYLVQRVRTGAPGKPPRFFWCPT